MSDNYEAVRSLPFPAVASALGIDFTAFKRDNRKREWVGLCPIHRSKNNKGCFRYNDDGRYHCFSCSAKGSGAIDLVKETLKIGFREAVERLGSIQPLPVETKHLDAPIASGGKPRGNFNPASYAKFQKWPSEWLDKRGLTRETCEAYGVFHYFNASRKSQYNDSVLIPFRDFGTGAVDGYMSRNIGEMTDGKPKYRVPAGLEKSKYLFGGFEAKQKAPVRVLLVVESPFASLRLHQLGFCAVAMFGWSCSTEQRKLLQALARGVVFLPDCDKREQAAGSVAELASTCWLRFPMLPDGISDPEKLSAEQIRSLLS